MIALCIRVAASLRMRHLAAPAQAQEPMPYQEAMPYQPATTGAVVRQICAACHGSDGNSARPDVPSLAGQVEAYLDGQVHAFAAQGGQRLNGVLGAIALNLSVDEMKRVASYFARQPPCPSTFVSPRRPGLGAGHRSSSLGYRTKGVASYVVPRHAWPGSARHVSTHGRPA